MTEREAEAANFRRHCQEIWGYGWQTRLRQELAALGDDVSRSTVHRMATGQKKVPELLWFWLLMKKDRREV